MIKRVFQLIRIARKLSSSGALDTIDQLYKLPLTLKIFFDMPNDWTLEGTHEDLFRLAHYVLVAPWDSSVIENWNPTRKPGWRPGLAFSGGIDSAAALALLPFRKTLLLRNM